MYDLKGIDYAKGKEIAAGKTKSIFAVEGWPDLAIMENRDQITKNDDPTLTRTMSSKAIHATKTTGNVFQLLKDAGIPVAFEGQLSPTEIMVKKCQMIPLEVIIRRYAVGSYLERRPDYKLDVAEKRPKRFHKLVFECFLKTTGGEIKGFEGKKIGYILPNDVLKIEKDVPVDDPFILDPYQTEWVLQHPKIPSWSKDNFEFSVPADSFLPDDRSNYNTIKEIEEIARKTFLVLEAAWASLDYHLIDFKIEFGIDRKGQLMVADVIDNDSWRLRTSDYWQELSKQLFRDNHPLAEIAEKYARVAALTGNFSIPKQALVFWVGSNSDLDKIPVSNLAGGYSGAEVTNISMSGHKSPTQCLKELEDLLACFPAGGVIITLVGLSNGLGPMLAARTSWPVIAVPAGTDRHDIWSSLAMPSNVPLMTVMSPANALAAAINILAQKDPTLYMQRQFELEGLDDNIVG